ncbi:hypothetical protein [Streptomyces sp. NPDC093111]
MANWGRTDSGDQYGTTSAEYKAVQDAWAGVAAGARSTVESERPVSS